MGLRHPVTAACGVKAKQWYPSSQLVDFEHASTNYSIVPCKKTNVGRWGEKIKAVLIELTHEN